MLDKEVNVSYPPEHIHDFWERYEQALQRRERALSTDASVDDTQALDDNLAEDLDEVTAALSPAERDMLGRYFEALVIAEASATTD